MEKQPVMQLRLVHLSNPLLLEDNVGLHNSLQMVATLEEMRSECLRHPPYSENQNFTTRSSEFVQFLSRRKINIWWGKGQSTPPSNILLILAPTIFCNGVNELHVKWWNCIDNNGKYSDWLNIYFHSFVLALLFLYYTLKIYGKPN